MNLFYLLLAATINIFLFSWIMFKINKRSSYAKALTIFKQYRNNKKNKNNWHAEKADSFDVNTIFSYFENHKPYLDRSLNLDLAADQIGIHKQQLSYIVNNKLDTHFPDLLSAYRVKEAQQILLDPIFHNYTIDAIAQEAGFNSRANFYEAFKKHTGLTPTQYRKKYERRKEVEVTKKEWETAVA